MTSPPAPILPYAPAPKRWRPPRIKRSTCIKTTLLATLCFLAYALHGPTSGQIRLDTGDIRYCWWGIPISYRPMSEPRRSKLLALASMSPPVPAKWVTCVTYPLHGSNNPDSMYQSFFVLSATWSDADPRIARWLMDDAINSVQHIRSTFPHASTLWMSRAMDEHGKFAPNWRDDTHVQEYCADHGYKP